MYQNCSSDSLDRTFTFKCTHNNVSFHQTDCDTSTFLQYLSFWKRKLLVITTNHVIQFYCSPTSCVASSWSFYCLALLCFSLHHLCDYKINNEMPCVGLNGSTRVVEVGGVSNFMPLYNPKKVYDLKHLNHLLGVDPAAAIGTGLGPFLSPNHICTEVSNKWNLQLVVLGI